MSNSVAVQTLTPVLNESMNTQNVSSTESPVQKPVLKVVPPTHTEPPTLEILTSMYAAQHRECWLCEGIAGKIAAGKEISEDDAWHFTSCILSWEYLHGNSSKS
ncbi:MAG: hypothetical protein EOM80_03560 [Erysipelotrichia bacterium]|nr:hypothetical protein [Erysipelotrichia bacterium]